MAAARREAEEFEGKRFEVRLDADDRPFKTRVGGLYSDMRKMARQRATPKVDVNVSGGIGLVAVRKQIASLPERKDVTVNVHVQRAVSALGSIVRAATSVRATAVASLVAIAPAAIMAAGAIGGVGVAALGVLAPLGLLGVAMAAAFKQGGPEIKAYKRELKGLKKDFMDMAGPGAVEGFKGLTDMFANLRTVLAPLRGDFTKLGKAVGDMFRSIGRQLSSARFGEFFSTMTQSATRAVPLLARSLRGLLDIFRNIATAGAPMFIKSLRMLADWLGKMADKTSNIEKLRGAFDQGAKALGKFWQIAKNVGDILMSIFKAGSSGSSDFLAAIQRATKGLAKFFASKDGQETLKKALASLALFVEELAKAVPVLVRAFGKLLDIATPIYKVAVKLVEALGKLPGGDTIGALALGFLAWKGPLGTAMLALKGVSGLMGKIIKQAGEKIAFRVGASAAGEGVAGAAGGAAGQKAAARGTSAAAATAGGAAGGSFLSRFLARVKGLPGRLAGLFKGLGPKILPALGGVITGVVGLFGKILPKIGTALGKLGPLLKRIIPKALAGIGATLATGGVAAAVALVVAIGSTIWMLLPKKAKAAIGKALKGAGKWVWEAIKDAGGAIKDAGVWVAKTVAKGVKAAAKFVAKGAADLAKKAWEAIKKTAGKFADAGKAVIGAVAKGVKGAAKLVWNAVKAVGKKAWETIKGFADDFGKAGKLLIGKLASAVKGLAGKVASAAKSVATGGLKAITGLAGSFLDAGKALIQKVIDGIMSMAGAAKGAAGDVLGGVRDMLPFSEPKDRSSPLYGLGKAGAAMVENFGKGVRGARGKLVGEMAGALSGGLAHTAALVARDAARSKLADLDRIDAMRAPKPLTRAQREAEVIGRIDAARGAVDEQGNLLNQPPPGVARIASRDERDQMAELAELRRDFAREDLERAANVNIKALIPSDPQTLRAVQKGVARGVRHRRRRRVGARLKV